MSTESAIHPSLHYYVRPERRIVERVSVDACVYGSAAGGLVCAIQLARSGRTVVVLDPSARIGGLTSGGLSYTDFGNKQSIGGIAREFYRRCGAKYGVAEEWKFEPHVAEAVLEEMVSEAGIRVYRREYVRAVRKKGARIVLMETERGLSVNARVYVDAGYEGDLMARARVSTHVGREGNRVYGETLNGVQIRDLHQFDHRVDPYVTPGDPSSGLLPLIEARSPERNGTGDRRIQAYNFRMCLTDNPDNRLEFARPEGYDRRHYELTARYLAAGWDGVFGKFDPIRGGKVDKNNHGATSTDMIGANHRWPVAGYAERERIFRAHVVYQMGWFWFLCTDPAVPGDVRSRMAQWGLCRDEFADTGGWPFQLYVREGRRMVSDYVMTELDCRGIRKVTDSVGLGAYGMDSHNCRRIVRDERVLNEGDVQVSGFLPYPVSYRAIVPRRAECDNLFVPVCLSSSHIAYGSIRMEPVFMILGQSAGIAADLAIERDLAVQDVPYQDLSGRLAAAGQSLAWPVR